MELSGALTALAALPGVAQLHAEVAAAASELRWHPTLRRRWQEARAETAVQVAARAAQLAGARVPTSVLRKHVATGRTVPTPAMAPDLAAACGLWHGAVDVVNYFPPLSGRPERSRPLPGRALLARWHRSIAAPQYRHEAGQPQAEAAPRLAQVAALFTLPGHTLVRAAIAWGELATGALFPHGGSEVGVLAAWYLVVTGGLDPTGLLHPVVAASSDPVAYRQAQAAYSTGTPAGVGEWIHYVGRSFLAGATAGRHVCDAILAGRFPA